MKPSVIIAIFALISQLSVVAVDGVEVGSEAEIKTATKWDFTPDPNLPNVLILGDSISIGYTLQVRERLEGKANVFRPVMSNGRVMNCGGTRKGLKGIDRWLAGQKWAVIHFNWGLHDFKHMQPPDMKELSNDPNDPVESIPKVYHRNLERLTQKIKATGARTVFATTTPVQPGTLDPLRDPEAPDRYNELATKIMQAHEVRVNDLYEYCLPNLAAWQLPQNVHFNQKGSEALAERVAAVIEEELGRVEGTQANELEPQIFAGAPSDARDLARYLETGGERKLNVTYKQVGKRKLQFDLYYPTGKKKEQVPLVIYTHGGGWAAGSRAGVTKSLFSPLFTELLEEGFAVASVSYRLFNKSGAVAMRDCIIDSKDAVRYLARHADELGIDEERFYVFGDSAGGQIAQMLLLSPTEVLTGDADLADQHYQIVAGVSWYGPCDFRDMNLFNHDDSPDFEDRFGPRISPQPVSDKENLERYHEMSPIVYLTRDSSPLLMIQGDRDTTIPVKHAHHMQQQAESIDAPVETVIVKNSGHNWRRVGSDIEPDREEINQLTVQFFLEHS